MEAVEVTSAVASQVRLLARAWDVSTSEAIGRLLERFIANEAAAVSPYAQRVNEMATTPAQGQRDSVPIHVVYQGVRIDAVYEPDTRRVEVRSEPLAGRWFKSPSGAACEVVRHLNPGVKPNRNGWGFWTVDATSDLLQSIR
jgi:hypothetical protein